MLKGLLSGLSFCLVSAGAQAQQYSIAAIGSPTAYTLAYKINDVGQVVGVMGSHGFVYTNGSYAFVESSTSSIAYDINAAGHAVGFRIPQGPGAQNSIIYRDGLISDLEPATDTRGSRAVALNDADSAIGEEFEPGGFHAVLYKNGGVTDLGNLGGRSSNPTDINNAGQIVGYSSTVGNGPNHAFLYEEGTMRDLGTLGGSSSLARVINSSGQIAGTSVVAGSSIEHAFLFADGHMVDLGAFGATRTFINDMNDAGVIVGAGAAATGDSHATIYDAGGLRDLNGLIDPSSGWVLQMANGINDSGQIVGYGLLNGVARSFILNPIAVTEPRTWASLLAGFGLVGGALRRRRSNTVPLTA